MEGDVIQLWINAMGAARPWNFLQGYIALPSLSPPQSGMGRVAPWERM